MNRLSLNEWSDIAQIISALAVVVSLVYVGWEIRANTEALRATTRQAVAEADFEYVAATLDPLALAEAEARLEAGLELSQTQQFMLVERQHLNFRIFENAYYQFKSGLLEPETWYRYRTIISSRFETSEPTRLMWKKFGDGFDESFRQEVASIRRRASH